MIRTRMKSTIKIKSRTSMHASQECWFDQEKLDTRI